MRVIARPKSCFSAIRSASLYALSASSEAVLTGNNGVLKRAMLRRDSPSLCRNLSASLSML
jgi:hypothetical protein